MKKQSYSLFLVTVISLLAIALSLTCCSQKETPVDLTLKRPPIGSNFYFEYLTYNGTDSISSSLPDTFTVVRNNVPFMGKFNLLYVVEHGKAGLGGMFVAYDSNGNTSFATTEGRTWITYPTGVRSKYVSYDSTVEDIYGMRAIVRKTVIDSFRSISREIIAGKEIDVVHVTRIEIDSTTYPEPTQDIKAPYTKLYYNISYAPSLGMWTSIDAFQEANTPGTKDITTVHFRRKMIGYRLPGNINSSEQQGNE